MTGTSDVNPKAPKWDDDDPLIEEQPGTWVYLNPRDQIVIRQRRWDPCGDDEPYVIISLAHVSTLIAEMQAFAEYAGVQSDPPRTSRRA